MRNAADQARAAAPCCPTCGHSTLGAALRARRKAAQLTTTTLAHRAGISRAHLCDIEKNRRGCSPRLRALYEAL